MHTGEPTPSEFSLMSFSSRHLQHRSNSESVQTAVDTATLVLTTLRDAGRLTYIPYLQEAAGLALGIVTTIQGARDNKDAFQRLANDACGLVYAIVLSMRSAPDHAEPNVSKEFLDNLRELVGTLAKVERFAKKHASKHAIMGIIKSKSDVGTILEYRESLRQSLDLFGLRSTITIQDNITRLATQQEELLRELRRLAARDDERRTSEQKRIDMEPARTESVAGGYEAKQIERAEGIDQGYQGHLSREATESEVQQTPQIYRTSNQISQRWKNPFRTQQFTPPNTQLDPMTASSPYPFLPHIQSSSGQFQFTSIAGDQTMTDSSHHIVNTNSGNTSTTITTNSNNDTSVRTSNGSRRRRRAS